MHGRARRRVDPIFFRGDRHRLDRCGDRGRWAQELAAACQFLGAMASAEEAVLTNPVKPRRQHVQQKAANEFRGGEGHRLGGLRRIGAVVLIGEAHLVMVDITDPIVGDRDAMRVPADVIEDLLRPGEGAFGVDDPLDLPHGCEIARPGVRIVERVKRASRLGTPLPKAQQAAATPFTPRTTKDLIEEALFARRRDLFSSLDL